MEANSRRKVGYQAELTASQLKVLQRILPRGFSLKLYDGTVKKEETPQPTKKQFTAEGAVTKRQPQNDSNGENGPKRVLRDKKNQKNHLEKKYSDFDAYGPGVKGKNLTDGTKKCLSILQKLKKHPKSEPFLYPVDGNLVPDYYQTIRDPMDLSKVEQNLKDGVYSSTLEFASDVRKIWNNAFIFNDEKSQIFMMTKEMSAYFERIFTEVENVALSGGNIQQLQRQVAILSKELKELNNQKLTNSPTASLKPQKSASSSALDKPMTMQEKRLLGQMIRDLPPEYLRGVCQIVSDGIPDSANNAEVLEFDIDLLPVRKVRELERYVKAKLNIVSKNQSKKKSSKKGSQSKAVNAHGHERTNSEHHLGGGHGAGVQSTGQRLQQHSNHHHHPHPPNDLENNDDIESKSSESSFITDSDDSDDERRKRHKQKAKQF